MKRFSARAFACLTLPVVLVAGVGFWAAQRSARGAIPAVEGKVLQPTPADVDKGALAVARIGCEQRPDDDTDAQWELMLLVRAGDHILWDQQNGDGERHVFMRATNASGPRRPWEGAFNLDEVPSQWGAVVLDWKAQLRYGRSNWFGSWTEVAGRSGQIVLRRTGQKLVAPTFMRQSHLRLIGSRIEALPASTGGVNCRLTLTFERDAFALNREIADIKARVELLDKDGAFISSTETTESAAGASPNQRRIFEYEEYLGPVRNKPALKARYKIYHGNYGPLRGALPLSDAKGRMLLGKQMYP